MTNSPFKPEDVLKFFEKSARVKFIDADTGKLALDILKKKKEEEQKSDYDRWLEEQDDDVKKEHEMGAL